MQIGEISKKTGLSIDTIRFYERSGLIKEPARDENGYRSYNSDSFSTLDFISKSRALDIPLSEIKKLLQVRAESTKTCREANDVIETQLINLRKRILELRRLEKSLAKLRSVCVEELAPRQCKIIRQLDKS